LCLFVSYCFDSMQLQKVTSILNIFYSVLPNNP
jgi:hypothetical protein